MATKNLELEIVDSNSLASPEPFNANFEKIDNAAVDYVVEQGESGQWFYRKWNSGLCEFSGTFTYTNSNGTDIAMCYVDFPFSLTKLYSTNVNGGISGRGNTWVMYVGPDKSRLDVWMRNESKASTAYWFMAHVVGRWK